MGPRGLLRRHCSSKCSNSEGSSKRSSAKPAKPATAPVVRMLQQQQQQSCSSSSSRATVSTGWLRLQHGRLKSPCCWRSAVAEGHCQVLRRVCRGGIPVSCCCCCSWVCCCCRCCCGIAAAAYEPATRCRGCTRCLASPAGCRCFCCCCWHLLTHTLLLQLWSPREQQQHSEDGVGPLQRLLLF